MRSKPILLTLIFSAFIIGCGMINFNIGAMLPYKTTYESLSRDVQKQVTCLTENMYFEAGTESDEGKKAVAFVTINRVQTGNYADNICGVVYQKTKGTCQFSWYCDTKVASKRLTIRNTELYNEIRQLATYIVLNKENLTDVTKGATYYHADYVNPGWKLEKVTKIGRHIFYRSKQDQIDKNTEYL